MKQKENCITKRDQEVYLDGVQKFMLRGIPVFIDGEMIGESELEQLLSPPEGKFYMADFVVEEMPEAVPANENSGNLVRESTDEGNPYFSPTKRKRYILKEIRFDAAYHS